MSSNPAAPSGNYEQQNYDLSDDDDLDEILLYDMDPEDRPEGAAGEALRGLLKKPRFSIMTCKQVHEMLHQGSINVDAEYQRDVVWPRSKQSALIQSFFMNYYIPPVIFDTRTDDAGLEVRTCIDGKQRLTSIQRFMDGEIPFITVERREKYWYKIGRNAGRQLPENLRKKFDLLDLQSVEYENLTDRQQRDIFQRVQMGMALSAPEKLQAIPGDWPRWVAELQKKYIMEEGGLAHTIHWDTTRARGFQAITAFVLLAADPTHRSAPTYASMTNFLQRSDEPHRNFKAQIETTLALLVRIASEFYDEAFARPTARVAAVESWFICLLIYHRMSYYSLERLARSIAEMRSHVRKRHTEIRPNARVIPAFHSFLAGLDRRKSDMPASEDFDPALSDPRVARATKRARRAEDSDPTYKGPSVSSYEISGPVAGTRGQYTSAQRR